MIRLAHKLGARHGPTCFFGFVPHGVCLRGVVCIERGLQMENLGAVRHGCFVCIVQLSGEGLHLAFIQDELCGWCGELSECGGGGHGCHGRGRVFVVEKHALGGARRHSDAALVELLEEERTEVLDSEEQAKCDGVAQVAQEYGKHTDAGLVVHMALLERDAAGMAGAVQARPSCAATRARRACRRAREWVR
jgi:hypothetical protein